MDSVVVSGIPVVVPDTLLDTEVVPEVTLVVVVGATVVPVVVGATVVPDVVTDSEI